MHLHFTTRAKLGYDDNDQHNALKLLNNIYVPPQHLVSLVPTFLLYLFGTSLDPGSDFNFHIRFGSSLILAMQQCMRVERLLRSVIIFLNETN